MGLTRSLGGTLTGNREQGAGNGEQVLLFGGGGVLPAVCMLVRVRSEECCCLGNGGEG
jgi:hypothetical protein